MASGSRRKKGSRRGGRGQVGFWPYVIAVSVAAVVVAVLIVLLIRGGGGDGDGGGGDGRVILPSPRPAGIAEEGHLLGDPSAAVTLIEYADFQ
jgi:hypothetical protein